MAKYTIKVDANDTIPKAISQRARFSRRLQHKCYIRTLSCCICTTYPALSSLPISLYDVCLSTDIRHVLLHEFESGHSAAEAYRSLCRVFGSEAPSVRSVHSWFERFRNGNRRLEDEPRSRRPTTISLDELRKLAEQHPYEGVRYFAAALGCSRATVDNGVRSGLGMVKKLGQ
ncbi:unnamed protein product [Heligmosomoides polygyrus]|uniref:HTH_48 domain-containing protein n=1 Tax=Heligmosomoides polygyrus TaxID=6339 RepID=A0A183FDX3_HELPZ|nr:unnamed protein product [Heligmosomoides polygyrus]